MNLTKLLKFSLIRATVLLMICWMLHAAPANSFADPDINRAIKEFENKNYSIAYDIFAPRSEQGNSVAQYYLGLMYQRGLGVKFNLIKGSSWLRRSAEGGFPPAMFESGKVYRTGSGVPRNLFQSIKFFKEAYDSGIKEAAIELANIYEIGDGVEVNKKLSEDWKRKAENNDNIKSNMVAYGSPHKEMEQTNNFSKQFNDDKRNESHHTSPEPFAERQISDIRTKKILSLTGRKIALVIGNNDYVNIEPLKKAVGDALSMKETLESIGFIVTAKTNLNFKETGEVISEFSSSVNKSDIVFFHFSGHGVEVKGQNLLLPIDVPKPNAAQQLLIEKFGLAADDLINQLKNDGAGLVVAVLDACRDNPFPAKGTRGIGASRGLKRMEPPEGTFIFYSAGANQLALDGLSDNDHESTSVFIRTFTPLLQHPNISLVDLAKEVQMQVKNLAATAGFEQTPAYYDNVVGNVTLMSK